MRTTASVGCMIGVGHGLDPNVAGAVHECCSHEKEVLQSGCRGSRGCLVIHATRGTPIEGVSGVPGIGSTSLTPAIAAYRRWRGPQDRSARVPRDSSSAHHARAGGPAGLRRQPAGARASARGGRDARRDERRLLHAPRARQPRRGLRERARVAGERPAARRGRARAPVRPGPHGERHPAAARAEARGAVGAPAGAAHPRSMQGVPAFVRNGRFDVLGANVLGEALYSELYEDPRRPVNHARFTFLDPRARDSGATGTRRRTTPSRSCAPRPAATRTTAAYRPHRRALDAQRLFRTLWASHDVSFHRSGVKTFHHPVVGRLDVAFEAFDLPADPGLTMLVYSAEPGSASDDALKLLASWAATRRDAPASTIERA